MPPDPFEPPASFVELGAADGLVLDLRYASTSNFLGCDLYGAYDRLFLHALAADKLRNAVAALRDRRPDLNLLVFDGLRPNRIQRLFWEAVRGTPLQKYVGDPAIGSLHGFGLAVDLSLVDRAGTELDMGTGFDEFSALSEPQLEDAFLASGALTAAQVDNRRLLREVMTETGFLPLPIEWWHFDALPGPVVRERFPLIE